MEINIRFPTSFITKKTIEIDRKEFDPLLKSFIDKLENNRFFDSELYNQLLEYKINKEEFDKMIHEIEIFSSYDENYNEIGFPYEDWFDRLFEVLIDVRTGSRVNL